MSECGSCSDRALAVDVAAARSHPHQGRIVEAPPIEPSSVPDGRLSADATAMNSDPYAVTVISYALLGGSVLQPEPNLHGDLHVRNLAVLQMTADLAHLKPIKSSQRLRRTLDARAYCGVHTIR